MLNLCNTGFLEKKLLAYEALLLAGIRKTLKSSGVQGPWAAVALAYHHGHSFVPVLGILPESGYESIQKEFTSLLDVFNPAEWEDYDQWGLTAEIEALGHELEDLVSDVKSLGTVSPGRDLVNRVCTRLRESLILDGVLAHTGIVYGVDYEMCNFVDNVQVSNPVPAVRYRGCQ